MTSAQSMEEELQQSVLLSEDAEYETADTAGDDSSAHPASQNGTISVRNGTRRGTRSEADDDEFSDEDASGEEEMDEDAEGEDDNDPLAQQIVVGKGKNPADEEDEEEDGDDEEEEEEGGEGDQGEEEEDEEEEEEEEGVGAVKIRPRESDNEDDGESDISDILSAPDEDSEEDEEIAWEDAEGAREEEEEEESEAGPTNNCIFCKQDEENDPSEDFEAFLACTRCGDNAHQQCARDAVALSNENNAQKWHCPGCDGESEAENEDATSAGADADADADMQDAEDEIASKSSTLESELSEIPRHLLAVKPGSIDGDSHSVFNELVLEDDPMDGSRMLRKRKSSSVESEEVTTSLRKKRRNVSRDLGPGYDDAVESVNSGEPTRAQPSRNLRLKATRPSSVVVEKRTRTALVLKLHVRPGNLKEVLSRRKRDRKRPAAAPRTPRPPAASRPSQAASTPAFHAGHTPAAALPTPFTADLYSQPFYSFFDKETDDVKGKPYGGILNESEADTSKTLPTPDDRRRFDQAKQKAEDEWRARILTMQAEADLPIRKPKKGNENASQIECIEFGGWEIDTWYAAPYPAEYSRNRVLYICEFCLKYMNSDYVAWRHKLKCGTKHPPGDEIYRHGSVSVFEVDGRKNPVYCQNLCLLAKLFLGSKTLYYDVEPFLFYVLCEYDDCGYHFVGYFSKEKRASSQNNVSCILTLPIHQRKGYGNLLIDFSYLLTKVEQKTGSPEKPLSDMGLVSYRNYWRLRLCRYFLDVMGSSTYKEDGLSVKRISDDTGMTPDDVISALEGLRALVRDPQTKLYAFRIDVDYCRQYVSKWEAKGYVQLKPKALAWTPYVMGRSNAVNFELGPPINTIAPREDDEAKLDEGGGSFSGETQPSINGGKRKGSDQDDIAVMSEDGDEPEPVKSIEKAPSEDKENATPKAGDVDERDHKDVESWTVPYRDIPAIRFEVFPPVSGSRRNDRPRQSVVRPPPAPRPVSSAPRSSAPRPKRPSGSSSRRSTASRPRTSSSRRKSGGTGRGPGRWPKGTKKSDYGNADSGPGLPPGWKDKPATAVRAPGGKQVNGLGIINGSEPMEDEVQVFVNPQPNGNLVNGDGESGAGQDDADLDLGGGDEDAEGEDA